VQNRMNWLMATLAVGAIFAAVSVGINGYRSTPGSVPPDAVLAAQAEEDDPLAPRLFDKSGPIRVHVAGAVKKPGVYSLPSWARVIDAVRKAGGPAETADLDAINLADFVKDGEQLRIPQRGRPAPRHAHPPTPEPPPVSPQAGGHGAGRYPFAQPLAAHAVPAGRGGPINLNTATREELDLLPGVGPATADRILAYRKERGPFLRPEDLMNVRGIGEKKFEQIRPFVTAR
jgi:competence protein ComEA